VSKEDGIFNGTFIYAKINGTITFSNDVEVVVEGKINGTIHHGNLSPHFDGINSKLTNLYLDGELICEDKKKYHRQVNRGSTLKLRIIGGMAYSNYNFSIDKHDFDIIEKDGYYCEPIRINYLKINAGQIYSILITFNQTLENSFWIRLNSSENDKNPQLVSIIDREIGYFYYDQNITPKTTFIGIDPNNIFNEYNLKPEDNQINKEIEMPKGHPDRILQLSLTLEDTPRTSYQDIHAPDQYWKLTRENGTSYVLRHDHISGNVPIFHQMAERNFYVSNDDTTFINVN